MLIYVGTCLVHLLPQNSFQCFIQYVSCSMVFPYIISSPLIYT